MLKAEAAISVLPPETLVAAKMAKIGTMALKEDQRNVSEIMKAFIIGLILKWESGLPKKTSLSMHLLYYQMRDSVWGK